MPRQLRALLGAASAALALCMTACWNENSDTPPPGPPAAVWIGVDDYAPKVVGASAWLQGEIECPECASSGWVYGTCPAFECPSVEGTAVWWTNQTTGATGPAVHGTAAACHCPWPWGYGYCYSACSHVWWTSVPLAYGGNDVVVSATLPGYQQGDEPVPIERVPATPAWLAPQAAAGQVTLAWTPSEGATSYNLYWSTTPYGWSSLCTRIENVASPYTHSGLAGGVEHYYFVTALAGDAEGFDSERLAVTPQ